MDYRNTGAPFKRTDGTVWARNAVHKPTADELRRKKYKLRLVGEERPEMFGWERDEAELPADSGKEWPLKMEPEVYLRMQPEGQHAELARRLLEPPPEEEEAAAAPAEEERTDGGSDE